MDSNIVELPTVEREQSEEDVDKVHAAAFRDLESEVSDLDCMGEIARDLIGRCAARKDSLHNLELATFAVWQLAKMLKEFKASYYRRYCNEPVPS